MQPEKLEIRRQAVASVAADLIAREGLEAATVRRIAGELGCSTTMITHYFNDKEEVLLLAYQYIAEAGAARVNGALQRHPGNLLEALVSMTAIGGEQALRDWRVYMAFRERAGHDAVFAAEQRHWVEHMQELVEQLIRANSPEPENARATAQQLIALVHGIALQTLFGEAQWDESSVREAFSAQLRLLLRLPQ